MIYARNSTAVLFATFVTARGEAATISGTPTLSVYHRSGGSTTTDVNAQNMTQLTGTTYYYEFFIGAGADMTDYVARFSATYSDGTNALGESTFKVAERRFYEGKRAGGMVQQINGKAIWTVEEKKKLMETVSLLKNVLTGIVDTNKTLLQMDKNDSTRTTDLKKSILNLNSKIAKLSKDNVTAKEIKFILAEMDSIRSTINDLEKSQNHNQEHTQMMNSLSSIKEDLDELAKIVIKIMPTEKIEEILNEH